MHSKFKITNYNKIGIINTAFIGDVVLSFFLAQTVKNLHPNSKLYFAASPNVKDLLPLVSAIDVPIIFDKKDKDKGIKGIHKMANFFKTEKVDLLLAPHRSARTSLVCFFSKPLLSISYQTSSLKFLYKKTVPYLFNSHEIERNFELLSLFEEYLKDAPLPEVQVNFPNHLIEKVNSLLNMTGINGKNIISIAPGSVWKTKQWKSEGFVVVANELKRIGYEVVFLGSKADFEICDRIATKTRGLNLAGKTNLAESLYIISISKLLITNDSSPTHLATLVNCPTITIYGPTIPEFGFYPRAPKSKTIQVESLNCKPCSIHGYNECPLKHHDCMNKIEPEQVLAATNEILGNPQS